MSELHKICVLFADIAGSTKLYEKLGDALALETIDRCVKEMARISQTHDGYVVKTIGDEILVMFKTPDAAIAAAFEIQQTNQLTHAGAQVPLLIKVGIQFGPALIKNHDVFGDTVNTAARLVSLAKGGQIITTRDTLSLATSASNRESRLIETTNVKGKTETMDILELIWQEASEDLTWYEPRKAKTDSRMILNYSGNVFSVDKTTTTVSLGRKNCDLNIEGPNVSRTHAVIERRGDRYILTDQSLNGTYITLHNTPEFVVHRDEFSLRGHGQIALGLSCAKGVSIIDFAIE